MLLLFTFETGKSEVLTKHFQQNWGAPYKFVVNVLSKAFSDAPDSILKALMRLRWAGRQSVGLTFEELKTEGDAITIKPYKRKNNDSDAAECPQQGSKTRRAIRPMWSDNLDADFVDFNELLSLGYMENDSISVSALSLLLAVQDREDVD